MPLGRQDIFTRFLHARPLVTATLLFLIGCILQYVLHFPIYILLAALLLPLLCALLLRKRKHAALALLLLGMLPLGSIRFELGWQGVAPLPELKDIRLDGMIVQTPDLDIENERCICVLDELRINDEPISGRIRLYLRGKEGSPEDMLALSRVCLGQHISCKASIRVAQEATNPGQYSFANRLRILGLKGYATAKLADSSLSAPEWRINAPIEALRTRIGARIDALFPESSELARAFILGDKSKISQEDRESYANSGVAHLLAISGMHVSALTAGLSLLLGKFLRRRYRFPIILLLLSAYGLLIGWGSSITRSILMYALLEFSAMRGRFSDAPTRLCAVGLFYLLVRPIAIIDPSFILSYGTSAGLILLTAPLLELFGVEKKELKHTGFPAQHTLRRLRRSILSMLATTTAAQLTVMPAIVHFFGAQPLWSFATNLICVPLAMLAYMFSLMGLMLGLPVLAVPGDKLFHLLNLLVRFFGSIPLSTLRIARFPVWLSVLCALIVLLSSDLARVPARARKYLPFLIIVAALISNACAGQTTKGVSIVFLDAGQADCAVIRSEGHVYLIDTGDSYSPVSDYLSAMNYTPDAIILTHGHNDHAGGLADVLKLCTPQRIYIPQSFFDYELYEGIQSAIELARAKGIELVPLSAGDCIALSEQTSLQVLSPSAGISHGSANNDSLVLLMQCDSGSALFCADAAASVIDAEPQKVNVLKVAHHGGNDALSPKLLFDFSPDLAVISVGENSYGHPTAYTLDQLSAAGTHSVRTDEAGAITVYFVKDELPRMQTYLPLEDTNEREDHSDSK